MAHLLDSLTIVFSTARSRVVGEEWNHAEHTFGDTRLYLVESGAAILRHSGQQFRMAPGRMYLVPAYAARAHRVLEPMQLRWVHFVAGLGNGLELTDYLACEYEVPCDHPHNVQRMFQRLEELRPGEIRNLLPSLLEYKSLILALLIPFFPRTTELRLRHERTAAGRFQGVLSHINANLGRRLRIDDLARMANLEKTYFSTLFARTMGVSPARFIQTRRVSQAQRLLTETGLPLEALAAQLGFADAFHLSKVFKKITGHSPQAFRNQWVHQA